MSVPGMASAKGNDEIRMANDERMTNSEVRRLPHSALALRASFVICHSNFVIPQAVRAWADGVQILPEWPNCGAWLHTK